MRVERQKVLPAVSGISPEFKKEHTLSVFLNKSERFDKMKELPPFIRFLIMFCLFRKYF